MSNSIIIYVPGFFWVFRKNVSIIDVPLPTSLLAAALPPHPSIILLTIYKPTPLSLAAKDIRLYHQGKMMEHIFSISYNVKSWLRFFLRNALMDFLLPAWLWQGERSICSLACVLLRECMP